MTCKDKHKMCKTKTFSFQIILHVQDSFIAREHHNAFPPTNCVMVKDNVL